MAGTERGCKYGVERVISEARTSCISVTVSVTESVDSVLSGPQGLLTGVQMTTSTKGVDFNVGRGEGGGFSGKLDGITSQTPTPSPWAWSS